MQQVSTESSSWRTCYEKYIKELFQDIKWVISLFIELGFATQIVGNARNQLWGWGKNTKTNHVALYQEAFSLQTLKASYCYILHLTSC